MKLTKAQIKTVNMTLVSLVLIAMLIVPTTLKAANFLDGNKKNIDYSEKVLFLNDYIQKLQNPTTPNPSDVGTQSISGNVNDIFLFFSKGTEDIVLKYEGNRNPTLNGDFVFKRPDTQPCENKACICYSNNAKFWKETEEEPYIARNSLFVSLLEFDPWDDPRVKCVESHDPDIIFLNSRQIDTQFNQDANNFIPMMIPIALQSELTDEYVLTLFDDAEYNENSKRFEVDSNYEKELRSFAYKNYKWEGGVAIGGMGAVLTNKDKSKNKLSLNTYSLTLEKVPGTKAIGVCLQEKCIYSGAEQIAKNYETILNEREEISLKFNVLNNYLTGSFKSCSVDCISILTESFSSVFLPSSDLYQIKLEKNDKLTKVTLMNSGTVLSSFDWNLRMPKLGEEEKDEILITGTVDSKLIIDKMNYVFNSKLDSGVLVYYLEKK